MTIHKLPSQRPSQPLASTPQPRSTPAPTVATPPPPPPARKDDFRQELRAKGPDLEGARRDFTSSGATHPEGGPGVPAHQLLRSGSRSFEGRGGGTEQTRTPTPVAPTQTATPTQVTDPTQAPLDLGPYLTDPAKAAQLASDLRAKGLEGYALAVERAAKNPTYAKWVGEGATITLTTSKGNDGQPVMVLVPPGFDLKATTPVHTHYHGLNSPVAADPDSAGTTATIDSLWHSTDPAPIFVLPEAVDIPGDSGTYGGWPANPNVDLTTQDALRSVYGADVKPDDPRVGERIVSAHSRGGAALTRSILADPTSVRADRLLLLDCLYNTKDANGADVDPDVVISNWLVNTDSGKGVEKVVFYENSSSGPSLGNALKDSGRYTHVSASTHDAANSDGMSWGYELLRNDSGTATPGATPTP